MEDSGQENAFECMERNNMQSKLFSFTKFYNSQKYKGNYSIGPLLLLFS